MNFKLFFWISLSSLPFSIQTSFSADYFSDLNLKSKMRPFQSSVEASVFRDFSEKEKEFSARSQVDATYHFFAPYYISLSEHFTHSFTAYSDPSKNFNLSDLTLGFGNSKIFERSGYVFSSQLDLVFPVSESSRMASLRIGYGIETYLKKQFGRWKVGLGNDLFGFYYRYKTGNIYGTEYNPQWVLLNKIFWGVSILSRLNWKGLLSVHHSKNFAGTMEQIYSAETGFYYNLFSDFELGTRFKARNKVIRYHSFLNSEKTSIGLELTYSLGQKS